MAEKRKHHFLEAFLEGSEAAIDLATDNEAIRAVPVIGTALRVLHGIDDVRSRAFAAKLRKFIDAPELHTEKTRAKLKDGIASSSDNAEKIGETLFLVLERMTDLEKPALLARVFAAYLDGVIDSALLRRAAHAMDAAFTDDLLALSKWDTNINASYATEWMMPLAAAGITHTVAGRTYDDQGTIYYHLTDLGKALHKALQYQT